MVKNVCICGIFLQLVMGPSGVLQGIRPGKCYIEMSTVDPETITELSQVYSNTHTHHQELSKPSK